MNRTLVTSPSLIAPGLVCSLLAGVSLTAAEPPPLKPIDLSQGVKIFASHATPGDEFKIENAIDRNLETKWVGEAHPLTFQPANIVLEFSAATAVQRVV